MARYLQVALALLVAAAGAIHRRSLSLANAAAGFVIAALLLVRRDRLRDQHTLGPVPWWSTKPSLAALFISQLIVFLVFPLVAISSGLAVWGLYTLFAGGAST